MDYRRQLQDFDPSHASLRAENCAAVSSRCETVREYAVPWRVERRASRSIRDAPLAPVRDTIETVNTLASRVFFSVPNLSPEESERIVQAVRDAEKGTSGEIVPCIVAASDEYPEAIWITAATATALAAVLLQLVHWLRPELPIATPMLQATLPVALGAVAAASVALLPALRRRVVGRNRCGERVKERAMRSFVECGVFQT